MTTLRLLPLLVLAIAAGPATQPAQLVPDPTLATGWDTAANAKAATKPAGGGITLSTRDAAPRFIRSTIDLPPGLARVRVSARVKVTGLRLGDKEWQDARIATRFLDAAGTEVRTPAGAWSPRASADCDWRTIYSDLDVPPSAVKLSLEATLAAPAGQMEIESITVLADPPPLAIAWTPDFPAGRLDTGDDTEPTGWWLGGNRAITWVCPTPAERGFLRLTNTDTARTVECLCRVAIPDGTKTVTVAALLRGTNLGVGQDPLHTPKLAWHFEDPAGRRIGPWPTMPQLFTETPDWKPVTATAPVPPGAAYIAITPMLLRATGTVDVAAVSVK